MFTKKQFVPFGNSYIKCFANVGNFFVILQNYFKKSV